MKTTLILYGVFLLAGLGLLAWYIGRMDHQPQRIADIPRPENARWERPDDESLPFPYDLRGRIPAFLALVPVADAPPEEGRPICWMKGNLQVIRAKDWQATRPEFEVTTLPRPELEALMRALDALPEAGGDDRLRLERRDRDGNSRIRFVARESLRETVEAALADRKREPFLPPAVAVSATALPAGAATLPWPLRRPGLARLLAEGPAIVALERDIERLLREAGWGGDFAADEVAARVRIRVLVERP